MRNYVWPISKDTRRQVVSLRQAGMTVSEIARRLDLEKSSQIRAIQEVCDSLGRRFSGGDLSSPLPAYRRAGASS